MSPSATTPRLSLPLMMAAQAQKDVTFNEALVMIDALVAARGMAIADTPPAAPSLGGVWIVGAAPTGGWAGQAHALAVWTAGGWRFCPVGAGFTLRLDADGALWRRTAAGWAAPSVLVDATGGATVDAEARAQLASMRAIMVDAGLVAG